MKAPFRKSKKQFQWPVFVILFSVFYSSSSFSQILINEVSPRNASILADEYGEYEDWIELYNAGSETINLKDYAISDNLNEPGKWIFPEISIQSDSFLVILASGNDRKAIVNHWETVIKAEDVWKYFAANENPDPNWNELDFMDDNWLEGPGGFGRGDDDDNTIIADSIRTIWIRKEFTLQDTSLIDYLLFHIDYDDAFVAYLNGVEIARDNIGWAGKIENWNDFGWDIHEAQMFQGGLPSEFVIDQQLFKSIINEGNNVLAIQCLNAWGNHGNSSFIPFLSVGINNDSFTYQTVPDWFEEKKVFLHSNFNLSAEGETIILSNENGVQIDYVEFPYLQADHSWGRETDGSSTNKYFGIPTPGFSNSFSQAFPGYTKQPLLNMDGGFYSASLNILISNYLSGDTIRFTRDGSIPNDTSELFTEIIDIDTSTVIKARVFKSGFLPGEVDANTYIMNYESNLPVFSISMNPFDLWDWDEGIYVLGPNAEPGFPHFNANFWQDWEKPIHIEYYDTTQQLAFEQDCGVKIHGNYSRAYPMKSLRILANGKYGKANFDYPFFKDKDINQFRRFVLRNSGQDDGVTQFRDGFIQKLFQEDTQIDIQDYEPAVVFLNGKYWGIHNIREKIDRYYIRDNFGVHPDSVHLLRDNINAVEGSYYDYAEMIAYIKGLPVVDSIALDSISKLIDLDNFTDYFCAEMFIINADWPNNNIKYWKSFSDTARWRYIMTDTDFGFGLYSSPSGNELHRILHGTINFTDNHRIFRRLVQNTEYRRYFINRSADIFNTILYPENVSKKVFEFKEGIENEILVHQERWGGVYSIWESNVNDLIDFAEARPAFVRQDYIQEFSLEKLVDVGLDVNNTEYGNIKINTIIPDSLPWQGIYFDGNPIDLLAIADTGYFFSHWSSNAVVDGLDTLQKKLQINVDTNVIFKAHFIQDTIVPALVFSEINYHSIDSLDAGDWVEIRNLDSIAHNLSNWVFKDGLDDHEFVIADQTTLEVGENLVLVRDLDKFSQIYPEVQNVDGPFEFGLSALGDQLRLFRPSGIMVLNMEYASEFPWPVNVNETGKTIELKDSTLLYAEAENWFAGCYGGSPGEYYSECDTVGIEDFYMQHSNFRIYPNPANNNFVLIVDGISEAEIEIKIFNATLNTVLYRTIQINTSDNSHFDFDVSNFPKGLYFIRIQSDKLNAIQKLIIQ
jgi:hypothetical protein